MSHVFISYSRKNVDAAEFIAAQLTSRGATVFVDYESLQVGENFPERLANEIAKCTAVVFLLSEHSAVSRWVRSEIQYAFNLDKPIFPIRIDSTVVPPAMFFLAGVHTIDFSGWRDANQGEKSISKLAASIGLEPQTPPPAPPRMPSSAWAGGEKETRQFPIIIKPEWVGRDKLLPDPFEWCVVPAGKVTLEAGGYLKTDTTFDIAEFQIARYPITNAQFELFATAKDGWRDSQWWDYSEEAKAWRAENKQSEAARFANCADCPRDTVTWYAAVAFTRWLSAKTGTAVTLPTEQQWQRAAQGDDGRNYPWGNAWDAGKCNTNESKIGKTTAVTRYPQGASPFGVLDMSGNVWEWCLTTWDSGVHDLNGTNIRRVVRGSSCHYILVGARTASRSPSYTSVHSAFIGFRCVRPSSR